MIFQDLIILLLQQKHKFHKNLKDIKSQKLKEMLIVVVDQMLILLMQMIWFSAKFQAQSLIKKSNQV